MDNYVGNVLNGRYEIKEIVGIGGMAVVYKAYDNISNRTVAVKIMKEEFMQDEEFRRRFKNESKAVAILSHPNIVKVYDVSFGDKLQYMVMEYIDGISLKDYIEQQGVLTWKETVHFTTQILKALQHAHDKGIVHRDIKPQNIMLLHDGTIKVTDFGIARFSRSDATKTMTGKAIGSVHYISPEQARGEPTDDRADIYSVGVMLYEMLTGKLPFESDNAVSVAIMQLQKDAMRPREINPSIPAALEEITVKAMQKEPSDRYSSASEMLMDLKTFKENPNVTFNYSAAVHTSAGGAAAGGSSDGKNAAAGDERAKNKVQLLKYVAIACVTLCLILVIVYVAFASGGPKYLCPNLVGMTYEKARSDYGELFGEFKVEEKYDSSYGVGTVISQSISENTKIKRGTDITVVISKGTAGDETRIPNLVGKNLDEATELISLSGLVISEILNVESDLYPEGVVVSSAPEYNTLVYKKSSITLYVSGGGNDTKTQTVPNVVYQTLEDAVKALEIAGLSLGTVTEDSSDYISGIVIMQAVKPDTKVEPNSKIDLVISNGIKPMIIKVKMPNFQMSVEGSVKVYSNYELQTELTKESMLMKGQTIDFLLNESTATRNANGELESKYEVHVACSEFEGKIYSCTVNFTTGKISEVVSNVYSYVPNVYGKSVTEASQIIKSVGFAVNVEITYVEGSSAPVVKGQDPVGSGELHNTAKTLVTLYATQGEDYGTNQGENNSGESNPE